MSNTLSIIKKKIIKDNKELEKILNLWKSKDYKIVFTNGCFDIIHRGHIEYLIKASELGDVLIIGLNSDDSIKRIKGNSRPLQDESSRALILASFYFVNAVVLFSEDTPLNLIKNINPHVLVKGGDYKIEEIVGADFVISNGGTVTTIPYVEGYSTTNLIGKITT